MDNYEERGDQREDAQDKTTKISLSEFIKLTWRVAKDLQMVDKIQDPRNFERVVLQWLTEYEDQNLDSIYLSDLERLKNNVQRLLTNWKVNSKEWQATTYQQLEKYLSRTLKNTLATSYSFEDLNTAEKSLSTCMEALRDTMESSLYGLPRDLMSTSSTIAHTPMEAADASTLR